MESCDLDSSLGSRDIVCDL